MTHKIVFDEEKLSDIRDEIYPLLEKHWLEIGLYNDRVILDPDWDRYDTAESAGMLKTITARDKGKLIGYYIAIVAPALHYQGSLYAVNDVVYLDGDYRNSKVGFKMFQYAEEVFKRMGCHVMTVHMKTQLPFDSLCEGLDMDYAERLYTKYIGE